MKDVKLVKRSQQGVYKKNPSEHYEDTRFTSKDATGAFVIGLYGVGLLWVTLFLQSWT